MPIELWTSNELFELRQDDRMNNLPSYFLDTFFTQTYFAEDREILFADLPEADRFLAPFVLPYEQGKPTQGMQGESVQAFLPPYIKLKDAVRPTDARNYKPSEIFRNGGERPSLQERFDARVVELTERHLRMIRAREIWMAARAFIDGKVQIDYDRDQGTAHPSVMLDFGRSPSHTVIKTGDFWNDPDTNLLADVETWGNTMYLSNGGGHPVSMVVGAQVAGLFKRNNWIKEALDTTYRGNNSVEMDLGVQFIERPLTYVGRLKSGLDVWTYKDTVDIPNGSGGKTKVDILDPRDVLLIASGARGVRAYGAIYDVDAFDAGQISTDIFGKMFDTKDPGERFVMHQASPLPIMTTPNKVFRARVLP